MTGWRDTVRILPDTPTQVTARITAALDAAEPWLPLGRLAGTGGLPVTIAWCAPAPGEVWSGQSDYTQIRLNADTLNPVGGWWEQTLLHEAVHILDKRCLTPTDRARVMALVDGCLNRDSDGYCRQPVTPTWGLDGDVPYSQRCGELFAETASRHIWFTLVQHLAGADLPAYGPYTFDPAVILPVMLDVLAGPVVKPPITPQAPSPTPQEDPAMAVIAKWIYGEGADLLAAMSAARATGAAVVTNRGEAAALIKAGATVTVIGGPACTALALTWAVSGGATTKGAVTACLGSSFGDSLTMALSA